MISTRSGLIFVTDDIRKTMLKISAVTNQAAIGFFIVVIYLSFTKKHSELGFNTTNYKLTFPSLWDQKRVGPAPE